MSGGSLDYGYFQVRDLADEIERKFVKGGKVIHTYTGEEIEFDHLADCSDEKRVEILASVQKLIEDLRSCSARAKEVEWLLSGDIGANSYLERISHL